MIEIENILKKYSKEDYNLFFDTVDMLCKKGVAKGSFENYAVLVDVISILTCCENYIKNRKRGVDEKEQPNI